MYGKDFYSTESKHFCYEVSNVWNNENYFDNYNSENKHINSQIISIIPFYHKCYIILSTVVYFKKFKICFGQINLPSERIKITSKIRISQKP